MLLGNFKNVWHTQPWGRVLVLCLPFQGMLDLDKLAGACGVHKPPSGAVHQDEQKKKRQGIKTFNRTESWSLAGVSSMVADGT
jgi:hypothetical protein